MWAASLFLGLFLTGWTLQSESFVIEARDNPTGAKAIWDKKETVRLDSHPHHWQAVFYSDFNTSKDLSFAAKLSTLSANVKEGSITAFALSKKAGLFFNMPLSQAVNLVDNEFLGEDIETVVDYLLKPYIWWLIPSEKPNEYNPQGEPRELNMNVREALKKLKGEGGVNLITGVIGKSLPQDHRSTVPERHVFAQQVFDASGIALRQELNIEPISLHYSPTDNDKVAHFLAVEIAQERITQGGITQGGITVWFDNFKIAHPAQGSTRQNPEVEISVDDSIKAEFVADEFWDLDC